MGNKQRIRASRKDGRDADDADRKAPQATPSTPSNDLPSAQGPERAGAVPADDIALTRANVMHLQRAIGNRAVNRLLQAKLKIGQPGDAYEREADRVASQVAREPGRESREEAHEEARGDDEDGVRRQATDPEEEERKKRPEEVQLTEGAGGASPATPEVEAQIESLRGGGEGLPEGVRADFESRLGHDFGRVRVHKDGRAARAAEAVNAKAFTTGSDVVFGAGQYAPETPEGRRLLAHELTHVVQQGEGGERVQRYEAGEHAELGETQAELTQALSAPVSYVVKKGETLGAIARRFGLTKAELVEANRDKLRKWPAADRSGRTVEGFDENETISVPQKLNDMAKAATKGKSATFTVKGVVLEYGVGIALGDLYGSPQELAKASPAELKALAALIRRERAGGPPVTVDEWQKASGAKFLALAEKNVAHYAPQNASMVAPSAAGAGAPNHKSEWEKHHLAALKASAAGHRDKAMMLNAFADHFLTDAFAAGHLVNKTDVMEQFKGQLKTDPSNKQFTEPSRKFFDAVATTAFTGAVATEFSKYQTYEPVLGRLHAVINSDTIFSLLLQRIHMQEPDVMANAVVRSVHDSLNKLPGGLAVENAKGDPPWKLSGDMTLNDDTRRVARKAVAQSQLNVISVYNKPGALDAAAMFDKVWGYTPRPSAAGLRQLVDEVRKGTDITAPGLIKAVADLIKVNHLAIIAELVKRKRLKKV